MANSTSFRIGGITNQDDFTIFKLTPSETLFYAFNDAISAWNYIMGLEEKHFYETIKGTDFQKARFDIDIDSRNVSNLLTPTIIVNDLIYAILSQFKSMNIELSFSDILIYDSSGVSKDKYKYSYHVIIDHYYHSNNVEASEFFLSVRDNIHNRSIEYIDGSVYKSLQQFRIIGNTKYGDNRPKKRLYEWRYDSTTITWEKENELDEYYRSLIKPQVLSDYHRIPINVRERPKGSVSSIVATKKVIPFIPEGFELGLITDHGYHIKRVYRSYCPICDRVHDHENSYIKVVENTVILKCFRRLEGSLTLGVIEEEKEVLDKNKTLINMSQRVVMGIPNRKKLVPLDRSADLLKQFASD